MKTDSIGITQNPYSNYHNKTQPGKVVDKTDADSFKAPVDSYTPSVKGAADPATINRLWKETDHAGNALRKLIASALGIEDANGQGFWVNRAKSFNISDADRAQAQSLISEDGYFGVQQTTDRIMSFAKALVGEGASDEQIEKMRAATQKGFDEVAKLFGGFDKLPDVTKKTHEAVMAAFDNWKSGGASE